MRIKKIIGGLVFVMIAVMSFVAAPSASAYVDESINGTYYKGEGAPESIDIVYNDYSGKATVVYQVWKNSKCVSYFKMKGYYSNGYLVVSGKGTSYGKSKTMKVKITKTDEEHIKVITGNGSVYYFWLGAM